MIQIKTILTNPKNLIFSEFSRFQQLKKKTLNQDTKTPILENSQNQIPKPLFEKALNPSF